MLTVNLVAFFHLPRTLRSETRVNIHSVRFVDNPTKFLPCTIFQVYQVPCFNDIVQTVGPLFTANMATNTNEEINNNTQKSNISAGQDGENDIEAGENGMKIEARDLGNGSMNSSTEAVSETVTTRRRSYNIYWKIAHAFIWLVMTGYGFILTSLPFRPISD